MRSLACEGPAHGVRRGRVPQHTSAGRTECSSWVVRCARAPLHFATSRRIVLYPNNDKDEPRRIAESVRDLDLRYVTITGVTFAMTARRCRVVVCRDAPSGTTNLNPHGCGALVDDFRGRALIPLTWL